MTDTTPDGLTILDFPKHYLRDLPAKASARLVAALAEASLPHDLSNGHPGATSCAWCLCPYWMHDGPCSGRLGRAVFSLRLLVHRLGVSA